MSLFFGEKRSMAPWFDTSGDSRSRVTPYSATYLAPVFAAYRHITDYVSTLPIRAYRRDPATGNKVRMPSLPALLASQEQGMGPGGTWYGAGIWFGQAALSLAMYGNAVGWVDDRAGYADGKPISVTWLRDYMWTYDEWTCQWYVDGRPVPDEQVFHIPWISVPGYRLGMSPIEHFATMIAAGMSAQEYADVRRGGGIPPAILKNSMQVLDQKAATKVQDRAVASFASGKPFVSGKDWNLEIVSIPPAQSKFIQTLQMTATQTAAIFGLDPREVGGDAGDAMTYHNDEYRYINRANNMRPYVERLENAVSRLLPQQQFIELDTDAGTRTDIKTRTDVMTEEISSGVASVNEWRQRLNKPPVPGGDLYNVPAPKQAPAIPAEETQ